MDQDQRKAVASSHAARITRTLRRLFPEAEQQYERECISTKVFFITDDYYTLRVTWERLDASEGRKVRDRLHELAAQDERVHVSRYSRFDADVKVTQKVPESPAKGPREVELLVTPDDLVRAMGGSRMGVGGLDVAGDETVKYFIRMPTVDEFYQMTREAQAYLVGLGIPDNFPEPPPRWQVEKMLTPLPGEIVGKLLGIPDYY